MQHLSSWGYLVVRDNRLFVCRLPGWWTSVGSDDACWVFHYPELAWTCRAWLCWTQSLLVYGQLGIQFTSSRPDFLQYMQYRWWYIGCDDYREDNSPIHLNLSTKQTKIFWKAQSHTSVCHCFCTRWVQPVLLLCDKYSNTHCHIFFFRSCSFLCSY